MSDQSNEKSDRTQAIRQRAHEIWESEGRPEGREHEHWNTAARELEEAAQSVDPDLPGSPGTASDGFEDAARPAGTGRPKSPSASAR